MYGVTQKQIYNFCILFVECINLLVMHFNAEQALIIQFFFGQQPYLYLLCGNLTIPQ